jgi:hypothetical protein
VILRNRISGLSDFYKKCWISFVIFSLISIRLLMWYMPLESLLRDLSNAYKLIRLRYLDWLEWSLEVDQAQDVIDESVFCQTSCLNLIMQMSMECAGYFIL